MPCRQNPTQVPTNVAVLSIHIHFVVMRADAAWRPRRRGRSLWFWDSAEESVKCRLNPAERHEKEDDGEQKPEEPQGTTPPSPRA